MLVMEICQFNPLQSGVAYLYPLKTENLKVSWGIDKQHRTVMG